MHVCQELQENICQASRGCSSNCVNYPDLKARIAKLGIGIDYCDKHFQRLFEDINSCIREYRESIPDSTTILEHIISGIALLKA